VATVLNKKNAPAKSRPTGLLTWIVVGVVVVAVAGFVVAKVATSTKPGVSSVVSATMAAELGQIPASVYDAVGINSPAVPVTPPTLAKNQPLLSATSASGAKLPQVIYYGAEYCPFCAAQRWAAIVALSRFGTFTGLRTSGSSPTDVYPNTPTFSFVKSTYSSKYVVFTAVETQDVNHNPLQTATKLENYLLAKYDTAPFFPSSGGGSSLPIPFMDFGNLFLTSGASFNPGVLAGQTREQIAAGLKSPTSPITQAIIAAANYQTAAICKLTGNKPGNVCNSVAVKSAASKLGI
jgi:hypothetical protein